MVYNGDNDDDDELGQKDLNERSRTECLITVVWDDTVNVIK